MTTTTTRTYKETSELIGQLFDGQFMSCAQTDVIIQEALKRNIVGVTDYLEFHVREHKQMQELGADELRLVAENLRLALRAVEARL